MVFTLVERPSIEGREMSTELSCGSGISGIFVCLVVSHLILNVEGMSQSFVFFALMFYGNLKIKSDRKEEYTTDVDRLINIKIKMSSETGAGV